MAIRCNNCSRWLSDDEAALPCPRCHSLDRKTFDQNQSVAIEKSEIAKKLARSHYDAEDGLQRIFRITGSAEVELRPKEPIKLLEVNVNSVPSGVMPLHFGPAPASGIPYSSVIVEVTPEEFNKIQTHEMKLPWGWTLGEELPRTFVDVGAI